MRFTLALLLLLSGVGFARDRPEPALVTEIRDLIHTHTEGNEKIARDRQRIVIAYDAMNFHIHGPDMTGRLQRGYSEHGPNRDGVVIEVEMSTHQAVRQMVLPQWLRGPYYDTYCCELKEGDRFLFFRVRFGEAFPAGVRARILEKLGATRKPRAPIPVRVVAKPDKAPFTGDEPLALTAVLRNGLRRTIRFTTFAVAPSLLNVKKNSVELVDLHRDGERLSGHLHHSAIMIPLPEPGPTVHSVAPQGTVEVRIDLREWNVDGGWIPGDYELELRLQNIEVDEKVTLSVLSDPVRFTIE